MAKKATENVQKKIKDPVSVHIVTNIVNENPSIIIEEIEN